MTSRTMAGVKLRQLAIENVWGIANVLKRSKTDRLHVLLIAIFISESNCIGVRCVVKIACKVANGSADVSHYALSGKWLRLNL